MKRRTFLLVAALIASGEARAAKIELTDGSVIIGDVTGTADNAYTVHMSLGSTVTIPAAAVLRIDGVAPAPEPPPRAVLRFAGSNTIGAKLAPALAVAYLKNKGAGESSSQEISPEESIIATAPPVPGLPEKIEITAQGSATGFKALGAGETEIGMASRPITQQELVDLAALGDMTKVTSEHILGLDGVAVIVNPANPVQKLTKQQLAQIFCGGATDWSAFGGKPGPIAIYARDNNSGTFDTFKNLALGGCDVVGSAKRFASSEELSVSVAADPGGIGFIGLAYVGHSRAVPIAECKLKYPPSSFAVKTEEYPLSRRLFLYTPNQHAAAVDDFLSYARSEQAQRVVQENGFIDLGIEPDTADTQSARKLAALTSPVRMEKLTQFATVTDGATRLSVTFRFRKNSTELDNRALVDFGRLKTYLRSPETRGKHVLLLGFSDDVGVYDTNVDLSLRRAQSIAAKLGAANVEAYGFGPEAPVACNTTPEGKDKNRHVEVWLR
jgi:phosphate transport system substrate-binding protein